MSSADPPSASRPLPSWAWPGQRGDETDGARRVLIVGRLMAILITLGFAILVGRVVQLQTRPLPQIIEKLDSQRSTATVAGRRGTLLDRRGRMVAVSRVAHRLFIDPVLIDDRSTFSERVGHLLGYDPIDIEKAIDRRARSRYIVIDERVSEKRLAALADADLPGLHTDPVLVRDYPFGDLAGQLVGFTGSDGDGLEGLERMLDTRLNSAVGQYRYHRDSSGRPLWVEAASYVPNADGDTVRLSLDMMIQSIADKHLAAAVTQYGAKSGQMIVMDPHTGEILAMANYPRFDPANFTKSDADQRRNRAVTDVFEPGSIFKPFIWAAATQLGHADADEQIDCTTTGYWRSSQGRRLRDASPKGILTWEEVLMQSSNIGMAIVGERIGAQAMHEMVRSFGFGQSTGSGLPGEIVGLVNPLSQWNHYSITSIPMGQEIGVTGLQMVRAFSVIANGGLLVTPTVFADGSATNKADSIRERILTDDIASMTRRVLHRTVTEGTGRKGNSDRYTLFGKTGTAQLPDFENGGYFQDQYVASFIAGAPTPQPRLVIGCFIHQPDRSIGHYGGTVAAPAVKNAMDESLTYLGVSPDVVRDSR